MHPARWPRARLFVRLPVRPPARLLWSLPLLAGLVVGGGAAKAEEGPLRTGVRGRIVVAPELLEQTTWPVDAERAKDLRGVSRLRRPAGRGPARPLTEPMPELLVVLEGARAESQPERKLVIEGKRFLPGQILVARPGVLKVENRQEQPLTVVTDKGAELASVMPGQTAEVSLEKGDHTISLKELPFARAAVKVIGTSRFIPWDGRGEIPTQHVESGEYQLAFYHGAKALRMQPLTVPDDGFVAIDATVSANGVVTVSIKDGSLRVAVPQAPIRTPRPAPPAAADEEVSDE